MIATGATRRARVQSGAAIAFSGRAVHHYWPLFAAYFRGVLLVPHGRAESDLVTWEWQEPASVEPPSRSELQTLRKRLAADRATFLDSVESIAEDPGRRATVNVAELAQVLDEVVAELLRRDDAELARCVGRTSAGLRLHGWGLTELPVVTYPDEHDAAETSASPPGLAAEPRPARRRRVGIAWAAIGFSVLVCGAVWFGRSKRIAPEVPPSDSAGKRNSQSPALENRAATTAEALPARQPEKPAPAAQAGVPAVAGGSAAISPALRHTGSRDQLVADASLGTKSVELEENALVVLGSPAGAAPPAAAAGSMSGPIGGVAAGKPSGPQGAGVAEEKRFDSYMLSSGPRGPGEAKSDSAGEPPGERIAAATVSVRPALKAGAAMETTERDSRGIPEDESPEFESTPARAEPAAELAVKSGELPRAPGRTAAIETNPWSAGAERVPVDRFELGSVGRRLVRVDDVIAPTVPVRRGSTSSMPGSDWAAALMRPPDALGAADVELTAVFVLPGAIDVASADWRASGQRAVSISADGRSVEVKWPLSAERPSAPIHARLLRERAGEAGETGASPEILALDQDASGRLSIAIPPRTRMRLRIMVRFPVAALSGSEILRWEDASGGPPPLAVQATVAADARTCVADWEMTAANAGARWTLRLRDANSGWAWVFTGGAESRP